jgi:hypothetical protein
MFRFVRPSSSWLRRDASLVMVRFARVFARQSNMAGLMM